MKLSHTQMNFYENSYNYKNQQKQYPIKTKWCYICRKLDVKLKPYLALYTKLEKRQLINFFITKLNISSPCRIMNQSNVKINGRGFSLGQKRQKKKQNPTE